MGLLSAIGGLFPNEDGTQNALQRFGTALNQENLARSQQNTPAPLQLAQAHQEALARGDTKMASDIELYAKIYDKGIVTDPTTSAPSALTNYGNSVGGIAAAKAGMARQAEKNVDLQMNPQIAGGEAAARLQQDAKYKPGIEGDTTTARDTAALDVERQKNLTKAQGAIKSFEQQAKIVTDNIDKAIDLVKNSSTATGWGNILTGGGNVPGDARKLKNYLETIKSNVGFDTLQQMRESSPTGGALGNVSDQENKLTQAVKGALDPLEADQLGTNLDVIKALYPEVLKNRKAAFQQDYGKYDSNSPQGGEVILKPAGGGWSYGGVAK